MIEIEESEVVTGFVLVVPGPTDASGLSTSRRLSIYVTGRCYRARHVRQRLR